MSAAALAPSPRPAGHPRQRAPQRPPLRLAAGGAAIALRVAETAVEVSDSRAMDRLVRSRAWIVIVGFGLIGIVAMQVSLLKLNSGIGRAVDTISTLERANATMKADISKLSSGDRIQSLAGMKGYRMPEPADVTYLRAGDLRSDGFQAARRMRAPDRSITGPAGAATAASLSTQLTGETTTATGTAAASDASVATVPATATPTTSASGDATAQVAPPAGPDATQPSPSTDAAATAGATAVTPPLPQDAASGGVTLP